MNKGKTIQVYFIRISKIKDQWSTSSCEVVSNKELVLITLGGLLLKKLLLLPSVIKTSFLHLMSFWESVVRNRPE